MAEKSKLYWYGMIFGMFYFFVGLIQLMLALNVTIPHNESLNIPAAFLGGCSLLLIGTVYFFGVKALKYDNPLGVGYVYVASLLAITFGTIQLLILISNGINAVILEGSGFDPWPDVIPALYLAIIPFLLLPYNKDELTRATRSDS